MLIESLFRDPSYFVMIVATVMFSICFHEYAHARVALREGDDTAADAGHLTLNPMVQMGPWSIAMLLFLGIAWGQVPVNPGRMRHRRSEMLVALAGPAANVLLFGVACVLLAVIAVAFTGNPLATGFAQLFTTIATLNAVLAVFNLLPIPPLDGFTVLRYFKPGLSFGESEWRNALIFIAFAFFLAVGFKYLYLFGYLLTQWVSGALSTGLIGLLFAVFGVGR